jgi:hypothetical protein
MIGPSTGLGGPDRGVELGLVESGGNRGSGLPVRPGVEGPAELGKYETFPGVRIPEADTAGVSILGFLAIELIHNNNNKKYIIQID